MVTIPYDFDQADWGSRLQYGDGELDPDFWPDKWFLHYGGGANRAGDHNWRELRTLEQQIDLEIQVLQGWQRYHIDGKGWRDIGYAYGIGQSGMRYRLRGENELGATRGDLEPDGIRENQEGRAVVFILGGNQEPTEEAYEAFRTMYRADPMPVYGHRDVAELGEDGTPTQCPGEWIYAFITLNQYKDPDMAHEHTPPAGQPMPEWAVDGWEEWVEASDTNPDSATWDFRRYDLGWVYTRVFKPRFEALEQVNLAQIQLIDQMAGHLAELSARIDALEQQPPTVLPDSFDATITPHIPGE